MSYKRIIPCLDLAQGRVVKGIQFKDLRDAGDPVASAIFYQQAGADELVILDITATLEGRSTTLDIVKNVASAITIPLTVGGGIGSLDLIETILGLGAAKVSLGSAALKDPDLINQAAKAFGSKALVLAIDVKKEVEDHWQVYSGGGTIASGKEALSWAKEAVDRGIGEILLTSMDQDGKTKGYDLAITSKIAQGVSVPVIASGGAGSLADFRDAVLLGHADAMLAASLFHFRQLEIAQVKKYLADRGIEVNLANIRQEEV